MRGLVTCPVYPTEDQERVRKAVDNLITGTELLLETYNNIIELRTSFEGRESLEWLRNRIHELKIIDVVRSRLLSNWNGLQTKIILDKQVAYHGRIKVLDDREELPPLGCIELQLEFDNQSEFDTFLRYFTPPTKEGHVVN
jgi:predicted RNA binding protein with dsRBD fold (UPF0201 family)